MLNYEFFFDRHSFICICYPGTTDVNCATNISVCSGNPCLPTTVAFNGSTSWAIHNAAPDIELSFMTSLKTGLILQVTASMDILYLHLTSAGLAVMNNISMIQLNISGNVSDRHWHNLSISLNNSSIVTLDNSIHSLPIGIGNISAYHLGSVHESSIAVDGFVGCMRDVKMGGRSIVPNQNGTLTRGSVGNCSLDYASGSDGSLHNNQNKSICSLNPCIHGTCNPSNGSYTCNCSIGYTGINCSDADMCASNPCKNGGACQQKKNAYVCQCSSGYEGINCETSVSEKSSTNIEMWIGIAVAILCVLLVIVILIIWKCKGSSGLSGSYSPTRQEKGQIQINSMPPIPPKERLI